MNLEHCSHHPLDAEFIMEQLWQIEFSMRESKLQAYSAAFDKIVSDDSIVSYKRMGAARRTCNTRLRATVANLNNTYQPVMR